MTKKDLITDISTECGVGKATVEKVLDSLASVASAELLGGGEVPLPGLGKLKCMHRKARVGINPKTKAPLEIPAKSVLKFVTTKELKNALKG